MVPKWATNIWKNVGKLGKHLNPKGGKMRIQPITLYQIVFGHYLLSLANTRNNDIKQHIKLPVL